MSEKISLDSSVTHAILLLLAFANHPLILFEPHRAMYC